MWKANDNGAAAGTGPFKSGTDDYCLFVPSPFETVDEIVLLLYSDSVPGVSCLAVRKDAGRKSTTEAIHAAEWFINGRPELAVQPTESGVIDMDGNVLNQPRPLAAR